MKRDKKNNQEREYPYPWPRVWVDRDDPNLLDILPYKKPSEEGEKDLAKKPSTVTFRRFPTELNQLSQEEIQSTFRRWSP